jgi:proteasome assembly chaperone (PAC2) family protein
MVLGLSGWMDGGDVSTGTIKYLRDELGAPRIAEIDRKGFYIYNFPGSMEVSMLCRPYTAIEDGLITSYILPSNIFYADVTNNLVLFEGKEPNMNWEDYTDCLFEMASVCHVETMYFLGSYAGVVPHTRDPRLYTTASHPALRDALHADGLRFSTYEGPAGIVTHLVKRAEEKGIRMASLVAEIPAYIQGRNARCVEVVTKRVTEILDLRVDMSGLHTMSREFEANVNKMIRKEQQLGEMVQKLEAEYDSDYLETEMGDLKQWLAEQGFNLG